MRLDELQNILPKDWSPMDLRAEKCRIISVPYCSYEYQNIEHKMNIGNYYSRIKDIYKVQNPTLYSKYSLRVHEYAQRGQYEILSLFHDTASENVESIAMYNFDWRYGERFKYGPGVYFSIWPHLANRHSFRYNTRSRSMVIVDVIVQNVQKVNGDIYLPDYGYDTVLAHNAETYVKYYDCEYYPRYVVDYISLR